MCSLSLPSILLACWVPRCDEHTLKIEIEAAPSMSLYKHSLASPNYLHFDRCLILAHSRLCVEELFTDIHFGWSRIFVLATSTESDVRLEVGVLVIFTLVSTHCGRLVNLSHPNQ